VSGGFAGSHSLYLGAWTSTGTDRLHGCKIKTNYNYASTSATALSFEVTNAGGSLFEAARIDSSGRVGIGTNSPNSQLDVNGAVTARGDGSQVGIYLGGASCAIRDTGTGSATYIDLATGSASHGYLIVRSSNAYNERLRIDDSGRVGIGTSSPTKLLQVVSGPDTSSVSNGADLSITTPGLTVAQINSTSIGIGVNGIANNFNGDFHIRAFWGFSIDKGGGNVSSGATNSVNTDSRTFAIRQFAGGTTWDTQFCVNGSGRVGIGISSPTTLLDVNSDTVRLRTARTPASATATGTAGEICWDANYIYVCTATDTWRRTALSSW
jgi:hypothetical protein